MTKVLYERSQISLNFFNFKLNLISIDECQQCEIQLRTYQHIHNESKEGMGSSSNPKDKLVLILKSIYRKSYKKTNMSRVFFMIINELSTVKLGLRYRTFDRALTSTYRNQCRHINRRYRGIVLLLNNNYT
ncbi:LOW QUALITY PROTEIN: hypothetical protein V1477_005238 [Vespula maculifrons]|uniref:Uncharacterized protein n=1 Tax=Vespula maculifrons TaxID=7453 RepID=A0ABD2CRR5_VESMC